MRLQKNATFLLGKIKISLLLPVLILVCSAAEPRKDIDLKEQEFKAVFLSKIPPYITWPGKSLDSDKFIIGILGKDEAVEELLTGLLKSQTGTGRECIARIVSTADEMLQCHIVFVPKRANVRWKELSKQVQTTTGILTIGETSDFIELGYVFNFNFAAKQKLEISLKNAKTAGLLIKPDLLRLGKVIK